MGSMRWSKTGAANIPTTLALSGDGAAIRPIETTTTILLHDEHGDLPRMVLSEGAEAVPVILWCVFHRNRFFPDSYVNQLEAIDPRKWERVDADSLGFRDACFSTVLLSKGAIHTLVVKKDGYSFVSRNGGGGADRTVTLHPGIQLPPDMLVPSSRGFYRRPQEFVKLGGCVSNRATLSIDGRYAMVSFTVFGVHPGPSSSGWNVVVCETERGQPVSSVFVAGDSVINGGHRCARFSGMLYAFSLHRVIAFSEEGRSTTQGTTLDFYAPETLHLFKDLSNVHTVLEEMVDPGFARITQSDGLVIVYATAKAPSPTNPFLLSKAKVHKVVQCFPVNGIPEERCCISPDGKHLLTLTKAEGNKVVASVLHYVWPAVRCVCMAMDAVKRRQVDFPVHAKPIRQEILMFMLPASGNRGPEDGDTDDVQGP
jgi:hypothetical protein